MGKQIRHLHRDGAVRDGGDFLLHTIGSHFTYSLTPYEDVVLLLFGINLADLFGWERNHYDRLVHLVYGMGMTLPFQQLLQQRLQIHPRVALLLSVNLVLSTAALYELLEWAAARTVGRDLGMAYLGTQGDVWDAHADIALAGVGAMVVALWLGCLWPFIRRARVGAQSFNQS